MASVQRVEEIERILKIPDVIRCMGKAWEMCQSDIENASRRIENIAESLQISQQTEGIHIQQHGRSRMDNEQKINKFNRGNAFFTLSTKRTVYTAYALPFLSWKCNMEQGFLCVLSWIYEEEQDCIYSWERGLCIVLR